MAILIQIILINLAVSADNVGVIAIATRNLPYQQAVAARRFGIILSLLLKLVFVAITGYLFSVPWLHIRIIGGIMLIYVTYNMLRQSGDTTHKKSAKDSESFLVAIVSIVAADVSMSLDNVIAILAIVTTDGADLGPREILLVLGGLVVCVPLLLWFSEAISKLMERFHILTYLCGGYLIYTATKMIFEDETIALFLESIRFSFTFQAALLAGALAVIASMFTGGAHSPVDVKRRRGLVPLGFGVALYALVVVGTISFVSTNPVVDGRALNVEMLYGFSPSGANAVFAIGIFPHLLPVFAGLTVGILLQGQDLHGNPSGYVRDLARCMVAMATFILLYLAVCTIGLTSIFGFGHLSPGIYFSNLLQQILLHCAYVSIFCMIRAIYHSKAATIIMGMLFVCVENMMVDIFRLHSNLLFFAEFFPDYYILTLPEREANFGLIFQVILIALLCIVGSTWYGYGRVGRQYARAA